MIGRKETLAVLGELYLENRRLREQVDALEAELAKRPPAAGDSDPASPPLRGTAQ